MSLRVKVGEGESEVRVSVGMRVGDTGLRVVRWVKGVMR